MKRRLICDRERDSSADEVKGLENENNQNYDDMDSGSAMNETAMNETQEQKQPHPTNNIPTSGPSNQEETSKDHGMVELAKAVNAVACAIQKSHVHWIENLANVVWGMEGYDDDDLEMVYDELCRDKGKARGFTYKLPSMRKRWVDTFLASTK